MTQIHRCRVDCVDIAPISKGRMNSRAPVLKHFSAHFILMRGSFELLRHIGQTQVFGDFMWRIVLFVLVLSSLKVFAQNDSQIQAIRKACAAGVLSVQECQQKLAKQKQSNTTGNLPPQNSSQEKVGHWSEPHGRYTIAIAPGWQVDDSQGTLKVVKGSSWAILDTESKQGSAMDVAQANAKQMSGMVSGWQVVQQQPFETPRHHSCGGVTAFASVPTRGGSEQRVMTFAAQSAGSGNFVTLTASSLKADAQSDQGQIMAMYNSVRFTGEQ